MRDYCPKQHLDEFDAFCKDWEKVMNEFSLGDQKFSTGDEVSEISYDEVRQSIDRNILTLGGWDSDARLRDMDSDGIAAEIIFHGLNVGRQDPMPFDPFFVGYEKYGRELWALGRHIYNQWLADFVAAAPERRAGLAQLPMWMWRRPSRKSSGPPRRDCVGSISPDRNQASCLTTNPRGTHFGQRVRSSTCHSPPTHNPLKPWRT